MTIRFENNASSTLAVAINDTDSTIQVQASDGSLFPSSMVAGDFFYATLVNPATGSKEIVKCSDVTGDTITLSERGVDPSLPAQSWAVGTVIEMRVTAQALDLLKDKYTIAEIDALIGTGDADNAQTLSGFAPSTAAEADTVAVRTANADLVARYFYGAGSDESANATANHKFVMKATDGRYAHFSRAQMETPLQVQYTAVNNWIPKWNSAKYLNAKGIQGVTETGGSGAAGIMYNLWNSDAGEYQWAVNVPFSVAGHFWVRDHIIVANNGGAASGNV
jgi:hypothetical protein